MTQSVPPSPLLHLDEADPDQAEEDSRGGRGEASAREEKIQTRRKTGSKADREAPTADGCEIEEFYG